MILIRPHTIDGDVLTETSADLSQASPWFPDITYAEGALVVFGDDPVTIADAANTTVLDLGSRVYSIEKTSGSSSDFTYDGSATAVVGFTGDFVIRLKHLAATGNGKWAAGLESDFSAPADFGSIDIKIIYEPGAGTFGVYSIDALIATGIAGAYAFIWRRGNWVYIGAGADFAEALASPQIVVNKSGVLYFDSAITNLGTKFEATAFQLTEWPAEAAAVYRSIEAGNLGNEPASSPSQWAIAGSLVLPWDADTAYREGDMSLGAVEGDVIDESFFNSGLDGWAITANGTSTGAWAAGGVVRFVVGNSTVWARKTLTMVPGRRYRITIDVSYFSTTTGYDLYVRVGEYVYPTQVAGKNSVGRYTAEFVAFDQGTFIDFGFPIYDAGSGTAEVSYFKLQEIFDDGRQYESLVGAAGGTPITIASPGIVTFINHGAADGDEVVFMTTGALPTGLTVGTVYFVKSPTPDTFQVAATAGGSAINTSGTATGAHFAIVSPNINNNPNEDDGSNWLDAGSTNQWAMFDSVVGTVTSDPTLIDFTLEIVGRADSLALINMTNAVSVQIIVTVSPEGEVYNETYDLTSTDGIVDWYAYFFEGIERQTNLLVTDLPSFSNPTVQVIITGAGSADLTVGNFTIGQQFNLGRALYDGAQVGIVDYSRKEADDFGNYTIVERAFSKRGAFRCRIARGQVDAIQNMLAQYRATPAVYSASADYDATLIFGFFRSFDIEIDYPNESLVSIELEGLS